MTRRVRPLRQQAGYSPRQLAHLSSGHDWPFMSGQSFGDLHSQPNDQLRETLADMLACWQQHQPFPSAADLGMNPSDEPAWFAAFASEQGIERLFRQITRDPMRQSYLRWAGHSTHTSPADAAADEG